jgi:uncharacterized membrane protein
MTSRKHKAYKAISFETISNIAGLLLAYLWFGNMCNCIAFTGACLVLKVVIFYYHEQVWGD